MNIYNKDCDTAAQLYPFYTEISHSNVLGSSLHAFHFKTNESVKLHVDYAESFYKMVLCLDGYSKTYQKKNHIYSFTAGKALLYKTSTETYESDLNRDTTYNLIHLHFSKRLEEELQQLYASVLKQHVIDIPMCMEHLQLFRNKTFFESMHPAMCNLFLEKTMLDQLYAFADTYMRQNNYQLKLHSSDRNKIYEAKELLDVSPDYITIEALSKHVGINTFKLKKLFKETFNKPVFEYQADIHFSKAYMLLLDTQDSIENIAGCCGYLSVGSFSNAFKRRFGIRPSELRKSGPDKK